MNNGDIVHVWTSDNEWHECVYIGKSPNEGHHIIYTRDKPWECAIIKELREDLQ